MTGKHEPGRRDHRLPVLARCQTLRPISLGTKTEWAGRRRPITVSRTYKYMYMRTRKIIIKDNISMAIYQGSAALPTINFVLNG